MLILCQSHHGDYACILVRDTVWSGNGMGSRTWVHAVRCAWALVTVSHRARRIRLPLCEIPGLVVLIHCWKPPSVHDRRPESCLGRGGRRDGQTGDKIQFVCAYHRVEKWRHGFPPGLILFRLAAPPLQTGVVGPYLVWGIRFPSRLLLEGNSRIQNYGL
jgi:hypothetical protein